MDRWRVLALGFVGLGACLRPHDVVLMADEPAQTMGGRGGATWNTGGSSGMTATATAEGSSIAPSGGSTGGMSMRSNDIGPTSANTGSGGADGSAGSEAKPPTSTSTSTGSGGADGSAGDGGAGRADVGGSGGATTDPAATNPDCDFGGVWAAQQLTVSEALGLGQTSNNWYLLEFSQTGDDIVVANSFDCGIEVRGSATVTITKATLEGELSHNRQTGRKGTLKKVTDKCVLDVERFWSIRGADEMRFLPDGGVRNSMMNIPDVAKSNPLPTASMPEGAIDTEGDGQLGIAFQVTGLVQGTRNSVQRDWTRWFTEPGFEIAPEADWTDLTVRADFDNEEVVLNPKDGLLTQGSSPAAAKHELRLRFLGRTRGDPRATAIIKSTDVDTCYAIQDAMPAEELK